MTELYDLDKRLAELVRQIEIPDVSVVEDLARGRRRRRRQRLMVTGAVVATLAVVGSGLATAQQLFDAGPDPARRSHSPLPSTDASRSPSPARGEHPDPPTRPQLLGLYNRVLAEHLDPGYDHLERYDQAGGNEQVSGGTGGISALGSKFGWTNEGERGLGMLQISVSTGFGSVYWMCGADAAAAGWSCRDADSPPGTTAQVAEYDGGRSVAVKHANGQVVILNVDNLFGNNSTVSVSGIELTDQELIRAAADERLYLPPHVKLIDLSEARLRAVTEDTLVGYGETLLVTNHGGLIEPFVEGTWRVDGKAQGQLSVMTFPAGAAGVSPQGCPHGLYLRCETPTYGGLELFVGHVRPKWGGGWHVVGTGSLKTVRVEYAPRPDGADLPIERAYALVTDDRLQP